MDINIVGTPPVGAVDTSFEVHYSDGDFSFADTIEIKINPTLAVYGDTRTGHTAHQQVVDQIRTVQPTTVFHVGDLVNNGLLQSDWDMFNAITADLRAESEFFPAIGNHEYMSQLYFDNFELPGNEQWYTLIRSHIQFIVLNTSVDIAPGSEQYVWLESVLSTVADSVRFVALVLHYPPFSTGQHTEDELDLRTKIVPHLQQHRVNIVFTGHDHDYERSFCGGIYYIVTGGGGAPLRDQARTDPCSQLFLSEYHYCRLSVVDDLLRIRVYDETATLIDDFSLFAH